MVADTGMGMSCEVRKRIFEPFFTTKLATGTGLGLWVTQDIMDKHRGTIVVRSRTATPGSATAEKNGVETKSGTVFMLFFPDHGVGQPPTAETAERSVTPIAPAQTSAQLA